MLRSFLAALTCLFLLGSCSLESSPPVPDPVSPGSRLPDPPPPPTPRSPAQSAPNADPELREFLIRAEFLLRRFVAVSPSPEEVERSLAQGEEAFLALLGLDAPESRRRYRTLQESAYRLLERRPHLQAELDEMIRGSAPPCESFEIVDLARRLGARSDAGTAAASKEERVVCEWIPYAAALVLCTISGNPVLYFACATIAMCNYCSGGLMDSLCGS